MFVLNSKISIGGLSFSGVNEVRIKRSIHSYVDTAMIKIPAICNVRSKDGKNKYQVRTGQQFNEGDAVTIDLGYNGELAREFEGFVKHVQPNEMVEVECEGYVRQLRLNDCGSKKLDSTSAKELLQLATKGTDIKVECPDNIPIADVEMINATGADICDLIRKATEGRVTVFFREPNVLWCGLIYTATRLNVLGDKGLAKGDVKYRIGYNVVRDSDLKVREPKEKVQLLYNGLLATKEKIFTKTQLKSAAAKLRRTLVHIPSKEWLQKIADEGENHMNYTGYEGRINGFLYPICFPSHTAYIQDDNTPNRAGTYIIESTEVRFGTGGAWRTVELGPVVNFNI